MRKLLLSIIILSAICAGWFASDYYRSLGKVTITGVYPDGTGFTSVTFIQDGREYGYDYLTEKEYLQFINQNH
jgi:hypothetical protein